MDSSGRLGLDLDGIGGRMAYAWGSLLAAVRSRYSGLSYNLRPARFGRISRPIRMSQRASTHQWGPQGTASLTRKCSLNGGWESVRTVVDVGGGTGSLLAGPSSPGPRQQGTLVDLPGDGGSVR